MIRNQVMNFSFLLALLVRYHRVLLQEKIDHWYPHGGLPRDHQLLFMNAHLYGLPVLLLFQLLLSHGW
jgi:hypothetical protein